LAWQPPVVTSGIAIASYTVSTSPATVVTAASGSAGGVHIAGLTPGIAYVVSVVAWDANGGESAPATVLVIAGGASGSGGFVQVTAAGGGYDYDGFACALRMVGSLVCWGYNSDDDAKPPSGSFTDVSANVGFACAVKTGGALACWGNNYGGEARPPSGSFTQVSAGNGFACGVMSGESVACWGGKPAGQSKYASTSFAQVSAGDGFACGVTMNATVACWGANYDHQVSAAPASSGFKQVSAGTGFACGLTNAHALVCWGDNADGESHPPRTRSPKSVQVVIPTAKASRAA
jgi:hypothetical protein